MQNTPSAILRYTYIVFLGMLIVTFLGFGISAFYPGPTQPDYSSSVPISEKQQGAPIDATASAEATRQQIAYDNEWKSYQDKSTEYSKNVSLVALIFSVVVFLGGLLFFQKLSILSDGIVFGSVLTLLYSIIRGFESQDTMFRFLVVSVGLSIAFILGYLKFVRPSSKASK